MIDCEVIEMSREQGDLPTTVPLGREAMQGLLDRGVPDLRAGQGGDVFDTAERFIDVFERYPVIGRHVALYHPDAQGPMDVAELVWGSDIFLAFYDEPDLVHAALELFTEHYVAFLDKWFELVPPCDPEFSTHWALMQRGQVMLRDDSLMNLSPEIYTEFIRDREARALQHFGGGAIHFCGRGDHFIEAMSLIDRLYAINLSQPHLNDMSHIFTHTVDKDIRLVGFSRDYATQVGRDLRGRVHTN